MCKCTVRIRFKRLRNGKSAKKNNNITSKTHKQICAFGSGDIFNLIIHSISVNNKIGKHFVDLESTHLSAKIFNFDIKSTKRMKKKTNTSQNSFEFYNKNEYNNTLKCMTYNRFGIFMCSSEYS